MGSVTHTPKAGALLTGAEYEADPHTIALDASDIPTHSHAGGDITSGTVADARIDGAIARDSEVTSAISALSTVYQPLDSDLTSIAALTTTAFGRGLLELANAAALLSAAGAASSSHTHTYSVALTFVIDGGGSAITTGIKGDIEVPFAGTITAARLFADQSGSIVVDLWKDTYTNYPPTVADTITASAKPTLSTATKSEDTTLTGWTTSISAGNVIRVNVDSATTVTRVTLSLTVSRTV